MAKPHPGRFVLNLLVALHLTLYTLVFIVAVHGVLSPDSVNPDPVLAAVLLYPVLTAVLLWTPLVLIHVALHTYYMARTGVNRSAFREGFADAMANLKNSEVKSYREGFTDAVRLLKASEADDYLQRLSLTDDGEIIEDISTEKRKRS